MKPNVCRCCLTDACYKDLSNEYYFAGHKEVYSQMLLDTFNVTISESSYKRLICEECIVKLRAAAAFKKQVIDTEETLKTYSLDKDDAQGIVVPKEEYEDHFDDASVHSGCEGSDDFDDNVDWDNQNINQKTEEGELLVIKLEPKELEEASETGGELSKKKQPLKKAKAAKKSKAASPTGKQKTARARKKRTNDEDNQDSKRLKKLIENSLKLVLNSNLCLFESLRTAYKCFSCKDNFLNITDLRQHTKTHSNIKLLKHRFNSLRGKTYRNVDISNLSCNICSDPCTDLNSLKEHLLTHDIKFSDDGHFLVPYRLEKDFRCVLCDQEFQTFSRLSIHMNTHYTNNVCEICGVSFISRLSLRSHLSQVHKEKKCTHCSATFPNNYTRIKHMRKAHKTNESRRHCRLCNKTFRYSYLLFEHKVKEHGAKRQICVCTECGKSFLHPNNLKVHVRSVHIRERRYPCSVCRMAFFTKCDQKRHERTHEDVRSFSCNYCEGRFKSKDSWRRHVKRQHGHMYDCNKDV